MLRSYEPQSYHSYSCHRGMHPVYIHMNTPSVIGLLNHRAADMISPGHITLAMYSLHTQTLYNKEGYIFPVLSHPWGR